MAEGIEWQQRVLSGCCHIIAEPPAALQAEARRDSMGDRQHGGQTGG